MAVAQGKLFFDEAGVRTLLLRDPHDTRVRLELARVLFLLHRYAAADYHFRLSAARSPTSVQHNISLFRRAIQAQRTWRVSVEGGIAPDTNVNRSEEHTSELQSLMRNSYAVFCLKKTKTHKI